MQETAINKNGKIGTIGLTNLVISLSQEVEPALACSTVGQYPLFMKIKYKYKDDLCVQGRLAMEFEELLAAHVGCFLDQPDARYRWCALFGA